MKTEFINRHLKLAISLVSSFVVGWFAITDYNDHVARTIHLL